MRLMSSKDLDTISLRQVISIPRLLLIITVYARTGDVSTRSCIGPESLSPAEQIKRWVTISAILDLSTEGHTAYQEHFRKLQVHVEFCVDLRPDDCFRIASAQERGRTFYFFALLLYRLFIDAGAKSLPTLILENLRGKFLVPPTARRDVEYLFALCLNSTRESTLALVILKKIVQLNKETLYPTNSKYLAAQATLAKAHTEIR
jgi:hypothetical protein